MPIAMSTHIKEFHLPFKLTILYQALYRKLPTLRNTFHTFPLRLFILRHYHSSFGRDLYLSSASQFQGFIISPSNGAIIPSILPGALAEVPKICGKLLKESESMVALVRAPITFRNHCAEVTAVSDPESGSFKSTRTFKLSISGSSVVSKIRAKSLLGCIAACVTSPDP